MWNRLNHLVVVSHLLRGEHGLLIFFRISMMITLIYILIAFLVHSVILGPVGDRTSIRTYHRQDEGSADQWLSLPLQIYMVNLTSMTLKSDY